MTRMARRRPGVDSQGSWITTYADMVTLILAFFIILFSISTIDAQRFERALMSLQQALGVLPGGRTVFSEQLQDMGNLQHDQQVLVMEALQLLEVRSVIEDQLAQAGQGHYISYILDQRGLIVRFADTALFPSSEATLTPEARAILDRVGHAIKHIPNHVRIEGHTDIRPINTPRYPSNWELSTARATSVIRYLIEVHGMVPSRLSAAGYGEYRPVDTNATAEGMQNNRRVDIIILRLSLTRSEPR